MHYLILNSRTASLNVLYISQIYVCYIVFYIFQLIQLWLALCVRIANDSKNIYFSVLYFENFNFKYQGKLVKLICLISFHSTVFTIHFVTPVVHHQILVWRSRLVSRHEEAVDEATRRIEQSAHESGGGASGTTRAGGGGRRSRGTAAQEKERAQRQLVETALERAGTHLEHSVLLSLDALLLACLMQHHLSPVYN